MPEKTGLEFLKQLRKNSNNIPFMLFTGMTREDVAVEALNLGADRYFNKNRNPETLYVELGHSLKKAVNAKKAEETIRNLAKFPSENPNPVMRVANDGAIQYANNSATKYQCEIKQGSKKYVPDILRKTVVSSLKSGLPEEIEIDCGGEIFSLVVAPIPEEGYANVYGRNISESNAAWNSLEETIKQLVTINEKLSVVSRLTRHDARNKLAVILNYIYLTKKQSNNENITGYLQQVESTVDQIAKIFEFAKAYEMVGIEEVTYSNAEKMFNEAVTLFSGVEKIKFTNECNGLIVLSDSLLRQLFYNLIHNSLVHGKTVNKIRLHYIDEEKQLKLIYTDNGIGVSEDDKVRIFKEGYGKGTGYGLYLIKKICEDYGWIIHEMGLLGNGAQFVMTIPKTNNEGKLAYRFETNYN